MDIAKGKLSIVLDGMNLGVGFEGFILEPFPVPHYKGDHIELII